MTGDVVDPPCLDKAVEGVDLVFHAAGTTRAGDEVAYRQHNTAGTRSLAQAVLSRGGSTVRVVLVSSLAAGGPSRPNRPRREEDEDAPQGPYGRSKLEAEDILRRDLGELPWTIARPPAVYGPRDRGFLPLARMASRGWVPGLRQPATLIHVRDLARGLFQAAVSPATVGRTYYLTHPQVTSWRELGELMARTRGKRALVLPLPRALIPGIGKAVNSVAGVLGKPAPLPEDRLQDLKVPAWTCDAARARDDFGFEAQVDLEKGIPDTMEWYRRKGWL
jgi:nucleoside-diphosphate-sugar epimerase